MNGFSEIIEKFSGEVSSKGENSDNTVNNGENKDINEFREKVDELDKKICRRNG